MSGISISEAQDLMYLEDRDALLALFDRADAARQAATANRVTACSIINARCGACSEDCAFCAQSKHSTAEVEIYPLVSEEEIMTAASQAQMDGAHHFGIVTSGRAVNADEDLNVICRAVSRIKEELEIYPCASLGILNQASLERLRDAGLTRYHHNIETAGSFFDSICTTRNYEDQVNTIKTAKAIGLAVCCGGIFGLGESREQRVELLETIRELDVTSVPLNFLVPIPGTSLEKQNELTPFECLKIIAVARLMLPAKTIRVCGGRESNLRDFQSWIFHAGADGLMIGGYLVTAGREVKVDLRMIKDAGMVLIK